MVCLLPRLINTVMQKEMHTLIILKHNLYISFHSNLSSLCGMVEASDICEKVNLCNDLQSNI